MAKAKDTVSRTVIVALALCIVCSIIVSVAAVSLRPLQVENRNLDIKSNILSAAGLLERGSSADQIREQFNRFTVRLVNLETGEYVDPQSLGLNDAMEFEQYRAASDPAQSRSLSSQEDIAGIRRLPHVAQVFLLEEDGELSRIVLPIHGSGLWSTLYGFVSLQADANTIAGLGFYDHAETPGLGGEIDNPRWKQQWIDRQVFGEDLRTPRIELVKGGVDANTPDRQHKVDSLAGATLTARGVENLVNFWMGEQGFGAYLNRLREGGA